MDAVRVDLKSDFVRKMEEAGRFLLAVNIATSMIVSPRRAVMDVGVIWMGYHDFGESHAS